MAEDLGTWPPEQAAVLLSALKNAGLSPRAKRTREGVLVTVDDHEAADAQRTLIANMDAIARAAKNVPGAAARQRARGATPQRGLGRSPFSRPLVILVTGMVLASLFRPLSLPIIVATVFGIIYVLGKQGQRD